MNRRHAVLPLAVFLLLAKSAFAQGDQPPELKSLSLEDLSKIEVTSVSKEPNEAFRTPAAISVLTRDDIRRSGATNIPDLLRLVPGVEVAQIDSDKWAIGIRGFQNRLARSVLVLIDGRSVYTPLFAGVYWEMQDTLIEDIERIEVIRGPGGTIWGANAVNGVINIITRNAKDTRGTLVSAGGGNVEQGFVSARYGAGDDNLSYRVFAKGFTRGPEEHSDGRNFDDWRRAQSGFRMDWNPNPDDSVSIQGNAYQTVAGSKLGISTFNPPALMNLEANGYFSGESLVAGWQRKMKSGADLEVHAYYDRTDRDDLNYREVRDTFDVDFIHHMPLPRNNVIWGAGVRISPSTFTQKVPSVDFLPHEDTYSIVSGFAQDTLAIVPNRFNLTVGTKLEYNTFSGVEVQPSARFAWTPSETQTIWGAFTRAVRTPSRIEEGFRFNALANPAPLFLRLTGDGDFSSEHLRGAELGYRINVRQSVLVGISGYYNSYTDLLSVENLAPFVETLPAPVHLVLPLYLRNGIAAKSGGVEISAVSDLKPWWRLRGSYSYMHLDAKRQPGSDDASTVGQLEGDSPRHKVVFQSAFTLPHSFEISLTYRYVSNLPGPDQKVPAYSTGDARIARRLTRALELSVVGQNLFQPSHVEYAGDPGPLVGIDRSAYLKLTWSK